MGACVAAAIIACTGDSMYAQSKDMPRRRDVRAFFCSCEYCGRAPDVNQRSAQCVACGAHLKENVYFSSGDLDFMDLSTRHIDAVMRASNIQPQTKCEWKRTQDEIPKSEPLVYPRDLMPDPYIPSPGMDSTDMSHPANPIGIFSPIWHQ